MLLLSLMACDLTLLQHINRKLYIASQLQHQHAAQMTGSALTHLWHFSPWYLRNSSTYDDMAIISISVMFTQQHGPSTEVKSSYWTSYHSRASWSSGRGSRSRLGQFQTAIFARSTTAIFFLWHFIYCSLCLWNSVHWTLGNCSIDTIDTSRSTTTNSRLMSIQFTQWMTDNKDITQPTYVSIKLSVDTHSLLNV